MSDEFIPHKELKKAYFDSLSNPRSGYYDYSDLLDYDGADSAFVRESKERTRSVKDNDEFNRLCGKNAAACYDRYGDSIYISNDYDFWPRKEPIMMHETQHRKDYKDRMSFLNSQRKHGTAAKEYRADSVARKYISEQNPVAKFLMNQTNVEYNPKLLSKMYGEDYIDWDALEKDLEREKTDRELDAWLKRQRPDLFKDQ